MLVSFIFPIADNRALVNPGLLTEKPGWERKRQHEFVRSFGAMRGENRGDILAENVFALGHAAINLGHIPPFPVPEEQSRYFETPVLPIAGAPTGRTRRKGPSIKARRLFHDGAMTARFVVALTLPVVKMKRSTHTRHDADESILDGDFVKPIVQHLCELAISIAPGRPHERKSTLLDAGPSIAHHFALSTQSRRKLREAEATNAEAVRSFDKFCQPGRPLILVRLTTHGKGGKLSRSTMHVDCGSRLIDTFTYAGNRTDAPVIVLRDRSKGEDGLSRNMHTLLGRYHATAEVAGLIRLKQVRMDEGAADSLRLMVGTLDRLRSRIIDQAGLLARAGKARPEAEGQTARLAAQAQMVVAVRDLWGEPADTLLKELNRHEESKKRFNLRRFILGEKPPDIFISYRHKDITFADRLYAALVRRQGSETIFIDRKRLCPGDVFPAELERAVTSARVVVVLIGPNWIGQRDNDGPLRIDDPEDWVRREIELALTHDKRIVPVLCEVGKFPERLPVAFASLRDRHGLSVNDASTRQDFDAAAAAIMTAD